MDQLVSASFGPDELASIRDSFEQACARLPDAGHSFQPGGREGLAAAVLRMGADGLRGDQLVEAVVRSVAPQTADVSCPVGADIGK
jgi:hypothetical protein